MANYGFCDDEPNGKPETLAKVPLKNSRKDTPKDIVEKAAEAGESLGFVKRSVEENPVRRRRKAEKQMRILMQGPARVLNKFQELSDRDNEAYWRVIERLMKIEAGE